MNIINSIKAKVSEFIRKRRWNSDKQIEHLRMLVIQDNQWMYANPVARALTERYFEALSDTWEKNVYEDVWSLRARLGLNTVVQHKLSERQSNGCTINGVAIQRGGKQGVVTDYGKVVWFVKDEGDV